MRDGHHASNRSDVLSTTPASRMASENAHDNVDATELTGCVAGLELRAEELLPIFEFYCSYGQAYNLELLKVTNFTRFVRDCKLLPTKFPSGELQVLFVRSTRPVTMDAQKSDLQDKHGEHAGKVHDATCLTFANWLESLCRIATLRIELRQKRLNKLKATRDLASVVGGNATDAEVQEHESARGHARMKSMVLQKQLEQKKTMSDELDEILENNVLVHASRLELLAEGKNSWAISFLVGWLVGWCFGSFVCCLVRGFNHSLSCCLFSFVVGGGAASELLEPGVTDVIRSDLKNLEVMFAYYSDAQKHEEALIGEEELRQFCVDFGLLPKLVTKLELFRIFRKVSNGRFNLGFPDFIECVGRLALTSFRKPFFETAYPTNPEKVAGFLQWLEDSGYQMKIIEHDRMHGHGYHGRRLSPPQLLGTRASKGIL